jgi:hypothetical protein
MAANNFEEAFGKYFGSSNDTPTKDLTPIIADRNDSTYTYKEDIRSVTNQTLTIPSITSTNGRQVADGNIDTIDQLSDVIKRLLNAAWGSDWGEFSPDLKTGEDSSKPILPQITAEINNREVAEKTPIKPVLMDSKKEVVDGKETGDSLLIYRQWFDCVIEFDFYGRNSKEARELQYKFETLLGVYAGYLKRQGISEIFFLQEKPAKNSLNFISQTPMKCVMYFVRFETITPVRQSLINKINTEIGIEGLNKEKLKQVIEKNQQLNSSNEAPAEIEFDFFSGDTGVTLDI